MLAFLGDIRSLDRYVAWHGIPEDKTTRSSSLKSKRTRLILSCSLINLSLLWPLGLVGRVTYVRTVGGIIVGSILRKWLRRPGDFFLSETCFFRGNVLFKTAAYP